MTILRIAFALIVTMAGCGAFKPISNRRASVSLNMQHEKVVVTGLGIMSPVGCTVPVFWDNLLNGASGIKTVTRFDPSQFKCQIAGQITDFDPKNYYKSKKKIKQNDLYCHFAVAASHLALQDAGINLLDAGNTVDATRVGCIIGSAFGGMESFERAALDLAQNGPNSVGPYTIPMILGNTAAGIVGMETGAKGPNFGVQTACATATHAFGEVCTVCIWILITITYYHLIIIL
jgi:3-oxoacyl-[acyl-carrier-protein] synthase II